MPSETPHHEPRRIALRIEPMGDGDVVAAARIGALSFPPETEETKGAALEAREVAEAARLREELVRPWARVFVAKEGNDGRVVAFAVAWLVADEAHVLNVATDPARRRRGAGRALLDHVLELACSRAVRHVLLEVRPSNTAAIALYRQLGFYAMGVRRGYYSDGEDALEMVLLFDTTTREIVRRPDEVRLEG